MLSGQNVTLGTATAVQAVTSSLAVPVDVTSGKAIGGGDASRYWVLALLADAAVTFNGSLYVYGDSTWLEFDKINGGVDVALTATLGWAARYFDLGAFARAHVAGSFSGGNVGYKLYPLIVKP